MYAGALLVYGGIFALSFSNIVLHQSSKSEDVNTGASEL
jgi:hypothetical protein